MQNLREESFSSLPRNSRLSLNIAEDNKPFCHLIGWKRGEAEAVDCSESSLQVETDRDYRTCVKHWLTSSKVWEGEKKWRKYWDWKAWIRQFWLSIICHWQGWGDSSDPPKTHLMGVLPPCFLSLKTFPELLFCSPFSFLSERRHYQSVSSDLVHKEQALNLFTL